MHESCLFNAKLVWFASNDLLCICKIQSSALTAARKLWKNYLHVYWMLTGQRASSDVIMFYHQIISPSGTEDDCFIQAIDQDTYSIRFMPRENGIHNIHCKFNGVHIPGSPFRIKVGKEDADPAAVHASGNGLGDIKTGTLIYFISGCNRLFQIKLVFNCNILPLS